MKIDISQLKKQKNSKRRMKLGSIWTDLYLPVYFFKVFKKCISYEKNSLFMQKQNSLCLSHMKKVV